MGLKSPDSNIGASASGPDPFSDGAVVRRDLEVTKLLGEAGPAAELSPYGCVCTAAPAPHGRIAYDDLFYVLPDGAAYRGAIVELEAGEYAVAGYDGSFSEVGRAHAALVAYAHERGLRDDLPRYEISALKMLDQEGRYRCTVEMRVSAT